MVDCATLDNIRALAGPVATVIAASVAAYFAHAQVSVAREQRSIAEKQAKIADEKLRLDLFNKRYEIYSSSLAILEILYNNRELTIPNSDIRALAVKCRECVFLFDGDVLMKISEIEAFTLKICAVRFHLKNDALTDMQLATIQKEETALTLEAMQMWSGLASTFKPYLGFTSIKNGE